MNRRGLLSMGAATALTTMMGGYQSANAQTTTATTDNVRSLSSIDISNMDDQTRLVISHAITNEGERNFAVISKNNPRFYIIENGIVVASYAVGLGQNNAADETNVNLTNKSTPAGKFGVAISAAPANISDRPAVLFHCNRAQTKCAAIHATYLGEFAERSRRLETPTTTDNYFSNGCPNLAPANQEAYLSFLQRHVGNGTHRFPYLYVLPHDTSVTRALFGIPANFGVSGARNMAISAP